MKVQIKVKKNKKYLLNELEECEGLLNRIREAHIRGTNMWQKKTGKKCVLPDLGNLVEFLLDEIEKKNEKLKNIKKSLKFIRKYNPEEVCYDEFAYDRIVETYREFVNECIDEIEKKDK
jgi:hypothetical protein